MIISTAYVDWLVTYLSIESRNPLFLIKVYTLYVRI